MAKLSKKFSELNKGARQKLIKQYGSKSAAKAAHSQARTAAGQKKPTTPLVIAPGVKYKPSDIFKGFDPRSGFRPQPEPQVKEAPPLPPIVTPKPAAPPPPGSRTPSPGPTTPPTPPTPDTPTAADLAPPPEPYDDSKFTELISGFNERFDEMQKENERLRRQMMIAQQVQMQNMARAGAQPQLELGAGTPGSDMYGTGAFKRRRLKIKPIAAEGLSIGAASAMQRSNKMLNV